MRLNHAEVCLQQLMVVEAEIGDTIAVLNPPFGERVGEALAAGAELCICETQLARDDSYLLGEEVNGSMQTAKRSERYQHGQRESPYILHKAEPFPTPRAESPVVLPY